MCPIEKCVCVSNLEFILRGFSIMKGMFRKHRKMMGEDMGSHPHGGCYHCPLVLSTPVVICFSIRQGLEEDFLHPVR